MAATSPLIAGRQAGTRPLVGAALLAVAGLWFSLGAHATLELQDEGHIVYPSWLVARGAVPHLDFGHLYGPSLFVFNGALLRVFGEDLAVIHASLVVLRAVIALLVFLLARRAARPPFAAAAFVLSLAAWGGPLWFVNTPYANHYALALGLFAAWLVTGPRGWSTQRLFAAGLCCGWAATFKQTVGGFCLLALLAYALAEPPRAAGRAATSRGAVSRVPGGRELALVGMALAVLTLVGRRLASPSTLVIAGPLTLTLAALALCERRGNRGREPRPLPVREIAALGLGAALPLAALAASYARLGALGALVRSAIGLPALQAQHWFIPLAPPTLPGALAGIASIALVAAVRGPRHRDAGTTARLLPGAIAVAAVAGIAVATILDPQPHGPPQAGGGTWAWDYFPALAWLGPAIAWGGAAAVLAATSRGDTADGAARRPEVLLLLFAGGALLACYPAADIWHLFFVLPGLLPLSAWLLDRLATGEASPAVRRSAAAALGSVLLVAAGLPIAGTTLARVAAPPSGPGFARATGIRDPSPANADAALLVERLAALPADRRVLLVPNRQMILFLAARRSAMEPEGGILYLLGAGLVPVDAARRLVDEDAVIARLAHLRPLVVDSPEDPVGGRFAVWLPRVAAWIKRHYRGIGRVGGYRLLEWAPLGDAPGKNGKGQPAR